ncbi:MAG: endonuclease III [Roseburia sp.]|nr:endonuclease III [Anaeroplasma bactoclasticum]MCM1195990.1 endonuclease III [Roseburia sp.]MCM1556820.1 endonuclease III [Anaeroplasma bactoclasticum]
MNAVRSKKILDEIRKIIPAPKCELNYSNLFELVCAVMISSQTTDKRVNQVTPTLFQKYSTPKLLSEASYDEVFEIIKSLGFARNKAKNLIAMAKTLHNEFHDEVPKTLEELQTLSGVGRKTASVVLAEGYKIPAMPVDTHLERMAIRFGYVKEGATVLEAEQSYRKYIPEEEWIDAHHLLLLFGRYHCKAIHPECENCTLKKYCKVEK